MHPKYIKKCRICGSTQLREIVDLGDQFLQGSFVKEGVLDPPKRKLPTKLLRCDVTANEEACGLVQLAHTFPPSILYTNYWYRSGTNQTMRDHLKEIVTKTLGNFNGVSDHLKVLDIGCNDGTLLSYYPEGTKLYGVDPSDIAKDIELDMTLMNTMFPSEQTRNSIQKNSIDIVTSIAMFYDLEDPIVFAKEIASILSKDGVWVLEMSYLPLMLLQNSFDTICHEHIEYYSLAVLERIFAEAKLRVFKVEINDINGGSIRCYVCNENIDKYDTQESASFLRRVHLKEFEMALDTEDPYSSFRNRIAELKDDLRSLLKGIRHQGEKIHIYGASTKGNVLLQWYGIDNSIIDAAAERNPFKVGGKTLGTNIPIISEKESRLQAPKYYLVLPWHFKREFLQREYETIQNGKTFIFPLPKIELVNRQNVDSILEILNRESQTLSDLFLNYEINKE